MSEIWEDIEIKLQLFCMQWEARMPQKLWMLSKPARDLFLRTVIRDHRNFLWNNLEFGQRKRNACKRTRESYALMTQSYAGCLEPLTVQIRGKFIWPNSAVYPSHELSSETMQTSMRSLFSMKPSIQVGLLKNVRLLDQMCYRVSCQEWRQALPVEFTRLFGVILWKAANI